MKANSEKSHLLLSSKTPKKVCFGGPLVDQGQLTPKKVYFDGALAESSSTEKLLEI